MGRKKSNVVQIPLQHNYSLIYSPAKAVGCEKLFDYAALTPPPESYPTLEEAIDRVFVLFNDISKLCFPPQMPLQPGSLVVKVVTLDYLLDVDCEDPNNVVSFSKEDIINSFNESPSVRLVGVIYFWNGYWGTMNTTLQGARELQQYMQTPDMQELRSICQTLGATSVTGNGIVVQ
jgi:hypothetical protein